MSMDSELHLAKFQYSADEKIMRLISLSAFLLFATLSAFCDSVPFTVVAVQPSDS
jgi:hypothetical protein